MTQNQTEEKVVTDSHTTEKQLQSEIKLLNKKENKYVQQYKNRRNFGVVMLLTAIALIATTVATDEPLPSIEEELKNPEIKKKIEKNQEQQMVLVGGGIIASMLALGGAAFAFIPARKCNKVNQHKQYYQRYLNNQKTTNSKQ